MKRSREPRVRCVLTCTACGFSGRPVGLEPGRVVRCETCRDLMVVPREDGSLPASMAPASDDFPVGRLILASLLLSACLFCGVVLMGLEGLAPSGPEGSLSEKESPTGMDWVSGEVPLPLPLGNGVGWTYRLERGRLFSEEVVASYAADSERPRFRIRSSLGGERNVEVRGDGIYLVSERTSGGLFRYSPPCLMMPLPLYADSTWESSGKRFPRGGEAEGYDLFFSSAPEQLSTPMGVRRTVRVTVEGRCGGKRVKETVWYAFGLGKVRFEGEHTGQMVRLGTGERAETAALRPGAPSP